MIQFFYYGTVIFRATGINNSFVTQMILNGINFGTTFYGLYIVEHYGRRKSLIVGSVWMSMMFFIFASVGAFSSFPCPLDHSHLSSHITVLTLSSRPLFS